ncbi:membrane protein [Amylibacter marinus]|uniref:Membrane protein n=1 Tax=Amylibacter marinus TaxID=1475483 RepID=A0ABQ5VXA5_9RHOB|nr:DMT family transporter [Amylibacter marinus]GLQ36061.1 membrane protein [Amylibacter marinus]
MNTPPKLANSNLIGAAWMIAAMACFALEDVFLKRAMQGISIGYAMALFGVCGAIIFACCARAQGRRLYIPEVLSPPMRTRMLFESTGRLFYTLALALAPLSSATAILQATPVVVVAGAALFFGEHIGPRRWMAIFLGFIGVMVIIQPSSDSFTIYSLFAVMGMIGFAGRDLASRAAPRTIHTTLLGLYGFLTMAVVGAGFALWQGQPMPVLSWGWVRALLVSVLFGVLAYTFLMNAMRTGDVGAVTPFRYTRLVFGLGCGVLFFDETLDTTMIIGSIIVVLSGLFILKRGR